jgi:hypothetical protein
MFFFSGFLKRSDIISTIVREPDSSNSADPAKWKPSLIVPSIGAKSSWVSMSIIIFSDFSYLIWVASLMNYIIYVCDTLE